MRATSRSLSDDGVALSSADHAAGAIDRSCRAATDVESGRRNGLQPIFADGLAAALPPLQRGFPERDGSFWERGFARLGSRRQAGPIGYLLASGGEDVGVLLTFRSERVHPDGARDTIVNLAGWYVDPSHRWKAPMMLRRVLADSNALFTDLTPSTSVDKINKALGFEPWNEGQIVTFLLPWVAIPSTARVETDTTAPGIDHDLLQRHAAIGCIAAVLHEPDRITPLLFRPTRRAGVRCAQLIYAESRRAVLANRAAVARFLVSRGVLVLTVDADRADCPRGSVFREGRQGFHKGGSNRDRLDYAFSELVLLDLDD